jgi:hypothetical protein
MSRLYLIQRRPKPDWEKAPYHQQIVCDRDRVMRAECGPSSELATVWKKHTSVMDGQGWLLTRWSGLEIDYGLVVHSYVLSDGKTRTGFWRDYPDQYSIQHLLNGAVWWSPRPLPDWLALKGVIYPPDAFSQQWILDVLANDGVSGVAQIRRFPACWPKVEVQSGATA